MARYRKANQTSVKKKDSSKKGSSSVSKRNTARPHLKKVIVADPLTEQKVLSKRPEPEFKDKPAILDDGQVVLETDRIFTCPEPGCDARFAFEHSLKIHKNAHLDRKLRCKFCGWMGFKSKEDSEKHLSRFHPNLDEIPEANPLQCQDCKKISQDAWALKRHITRMHHDSVYPCPHCGYEFKHQDNLTTHLKYKHLPKGIKPQTFPCEVCGRKFIYKSELRKHLRTAHRDKDKQYRCVVCNTVYNSIDVYRNHLRAHGQKKSFSCDLCNAHFITKAKLDRHNRTISHRDMLKSRRRRRGRRAKTEPIDIDSPPPPPQKSLEELRQMGKEELFDFCWERIPKVTLVKVDAFNVKMSNARVDRSKPNDENPLHSKERDIADAEEEYFDLKCVYCKRSFPDKETLELHEKTCFNVMRYGPGGPHKCGICGKVFKRRKALVNHSMVHSNERPFKCHYCDSSFKWKGALITHEKHVHFGIPHKKPDRVFTCNHSGCGKSYSTAKSLQRHIQVKHLGIKYSCSEPGCGKIFVRKEQLKLHKERNHSEEVVQIECKPCMKVFKHRSLFVTHCKKPRHIFKMKMFSWNGGEESQED